MGFQGENPSSEFPQITCSECAQAGNGYAAAVHLGGFPPVDTLSHVELVDLLGKGTAALVWSTDLPHRRGSQLTAVFGSKLTGLALDTEGGYRDDNGLWWRPSGRQIFDNTAFFRPIEVRDPFDNA